MQKEKKICLSLGELGRLWRCFLPSNISAEKNGCREEWVGYKAGRTIDGWMDKNGRMT